MIRCLAFVVASVLLRTVSCNNQRDSLMLNKDGIHTDAQSIHRSRRSILNQEEIVEIVEIHNRFRRLEQSSNMNVLVWNFYLAGVADNWAKQCIYAHSAQNLTDPSKPSTMTYTQFGQNVWLISSNGVLNITRVVSDWYNEKVNYTYGSGTCISVHPGCGHYTQVVWATSREFGCARNFCPTVENYDTLNNTLLVCNYGPPGNIDGQIGQPFLQGTQCTQCDSKSFWCSQGLCNSTCSSTDANCECLAECSNGGSVNNVTCACTCAPGWTGNDCSAVCKDLDPRCTQDPTQQRFLLSQCTDPVQGPAIQKLCPALCNICTAGSESRVGNSGSLLLQISLSVSVLLFLTTAGLQ